MVFVGEAVGGLGHAAVIIGNESEGYKYYSCGSGNNQTTEYSQNSFSNYSSALNALQETRKNKGENASYDDGLQAITSSADDKKAFAWAFSHRNDNYNPLPTATQNQCMTFAMGVLDAGGVSYTYPESPVYGPFKGCVPNDFMRINCFNSNFIWMKGKLE